MKRIIFILLFLLTASFAFAQQTADQDSVLTVSKEPFYLTLDLGSKNIIIPPPIGSIKISLVKVLTKGGEELLRQRITDPVKSTSVDISKLQDGEYLVQAITVDHVLYKTKLFIQR